MIGDPAQDVGKPGARVDIVQLGRDDERIPGCGALAASVMNFQAAASMAEGAPVRGLKLPPVLQTCNTIGIIKGSPHPAAAQLFVEYMLSKEALRYTSCPAGTGQMLQRVGHGGQLRYLAAQICHMIHCDLLGIAKGEVRVMFGGPSGQTVTVRTGGVVVTRLVWGTGTWARRATWSWSAPIPAVPTTTRCAVTPASMRRLRAIAAVPLPARVRSRLGPGWSTSEGVDLLRIMNGG